MRARVGVSVFHEVRHRDDEAVLHLCGGIRKIPDAAQLLRRTRGHLAYRIVKRLHLVPRADVQRPEPAHVIIQFIQVLGLRIEAVDHGGDAADRIDQIQTGDPQAIAQDQDEETGEDENGLEREVSRVVRQIGHGHIHTGVAHRAAHIIDHGIIGGEHPPGDIIGLDGRDLFAGQHIRDIREERLLKIHAEPWRIRRLIR